MKMPARQWSNISYRYGFNGKEDDDEVKGDGAQQDYGMRIYDPRLGKFLSVDPIAKEYPMLTPYQFASNRPIDGIDLDGLEWSSAAKNFWQGVKDSYRETKESLSAKSLKKTAKDVVGTLEDAGKMAMGKKGAAASFSRRITNFSIGLSNSITEPLVFLSTMHKRSINQNAYGLGFYGFQVGLAILPEVLAEATSTRAGMAKSYEGNQLIWNALDDGVAMRFAQSADDIRYMKSMNSKALYGVDMNNPNGVITLQKGFGRADILEEAIHHQQRKMYGDDYFQENVNLLEVQAQDRLLEIGKRENWSKTEIDKIRGAKAMWEQKLKRQK